VKIVLIPFAMISEVCRSPPLFPAHRGKEGGRKLFFLPKYFWGAQARVGVDGNSLPPKLSWTVHTICKVSGRTGNNIRALNRYRDRSESVQNPVSDSVDLKIRQISMVFNFDLL